jgi:hypothetical protein
MNVTTHTSNQTAAQMPYGRLHEVPITLGKQIYLSCKLKQ